jgi:hypothetical protein
MAYKKAIRDCQTRETLSYTNELHEALLSKSGPTFWKSWKSKFDIKPRNPSQVNGLADDSKIAAKFAEHFSESCTEFSLENNNRLRQQYMDLESNYNGSPFVDDYWFDVELIDKVIADLHVGKAAGLDNLTAEHLKYSHPALTSILTKLFNLIVCHGHVPNDFCKSYTVPLPKRENTHGKTFTVDDFRGISISSILSKVLEYCILNRYSTFFNTSDNQFGFKKGIGCTEAIYTVKNAVDHYVKGGSTVNICALDLSKAFDKTNHYGLYLKLMEKKVPVHLLRLIQHWYSMSMTCVKWGCQVSKYVRLRTGVRQGGVLSPFLFAVFIDGIVRNVISSRLGCHIGLSCVSVILYADDIILLAPSVQTLQRLIDICEIELNYLDMRINSKKSVCLRIGPRFHTPCEKLTTKSGQTIEWASTCRYLGIVFRNARQFKIMFDNVKSRFYKAFNAIFGKVGRLASEEVVIKLIDTKCVPILTYGLAACPLTLSDKKSLEFPVNRIFMKLFCTNNINVVESCQINFGFLPIRLRIDCLKCNFLEKYIKSSNYLCSGVFAQTAKTEINILLNSHNVKKSSNLRKLFMIIFSTRLLNYL